MPRSYGTPSPSAIRKREAKLAARARKRYHGSGPQAPAFELVQVTHTPDPTAVAVMAIAASMIPGVQVTEVPAEGSEAHVTVYVDGRFVSRVVWPAARERDSAWIEVMGNRLVQTVWDAHPDQGISPFGGNAVCSVQALRVLHGVTGSSGTHDPSTGGLADPGPVRPPSDHLGDTGGRP